MAGKRPCCRADCVIGRAAGRYRTRHCRGQYGGGAAMRAALGAPVPGLFLYRGAARRPARRSDLYPARRPFGRAASDSARRRAAGAVYDAGRRGRARSARLYCARRTPCVRAAPPALFARAILPHAGGNVRALRRSASALANSVEIAKRCTLTLELGKAKLPLFPTPEALSLDA